MRNDFGQMLATIALVVVVGFGVWVLSNIAAKISPGAQAPATQPATTGSTRSAP